MSVQSYSQSILNAYIRETVETWTTFSDGISFGNGAAPWGVIELPSDFSFKYGTSVNNVADIYVYGNGFLSFDVYRNPDDLFVPGFAEYDKMVAWYNRDLYTNGDLSYKVTGEKPFRVINIQHLGARSFLDFSGRTIDVQIKIFETTNEIQIIYGNTTGFGGGNVAGYLFFTGNSLISSNPRRYEYINIQPSIINLSSTIHKSNSNPSINGYLDRDAVSFFPQGRAFTYSQRPTLASVSPNGQLFSLDDIVDDDGRPFIRVNRAAGQSSIRFTYSIYGPIGDANASTIYQALDATNNINITPNPQPLGNDFKIEMFNASGIAAGANGILDLTNDAILPGQYRVSVVLTDINTGLNQLVETLITIADSYDLAITLVEEPTRVDAGIYAFGAGVPVRFLVRNQGATPIDEFKVTYTISGVSLSFTKTETVTINLDEPLLFRESTIVTLNPLLNAAVGDYKFTASVALTEGPGDDIPQNNVYPVTGAANHLFKIAYELEGQIASIITPASSMSAKQPALPLIELRNNGLSPITLSTLNLVIKNPAGDEVYNETITIEEIPIGLNTIYQAEMPKSFIPTVTGTYTVTATLTVAGDDLTTNNVLTKSVSVNAGMSGNYYINKNNANGTTIFASIKDAANALYTNGVSGNVTFYLQNTEYTEGNPFLREPAIDFSSRIMGLGEIVNGKPLTVTFRPDESVLLGSVVDIKLESASGIGMLFGNNTSHAYPNAPVNKVAFSEKNEFAVSNGHIIFDGGGRKGISFSLVTTSDFRAVFYLDNGANNITVRNTKIRGGVNQAASYECYIPKTKYDVLLHSFFFEENESANGTISAAVYMRSTEPIFATTGTNYFNLPIGVNHHNVIENNEISGYGVGVVSLGLGILYDEELNEFVQYFNHHNEVNGNIISNVSKAGVFFGFESHSTISGNNIYNVTGNCDLESAGILIGAKDFNEWLGYGNTDIKIHGNEISFIRGSGNLYGIKIEQKDTYLEDRDQKITYPMYDNFEINSNIVRDLRAANASTNVHAIAVQPYMTGNIDWTALDFPFDANYDSQDIENVWVSNNTIWISGDDYENTGVSSAYMFVNLTDAKFFNNATAMLDNNIAPDAPISAAVIFYGSHPRYNSIWSDNNIYWASNNDRVSAFRFIETDGQSNIIEAGFKNEFKSLSQWQYWTGVDNHSIWGDFTNDLELTGASPFHLRVKSNPIPKMSLLNNRGLKEYELRNDSEYDAYDIDGILRGQAGERYDVGASEFNGRLSARDLEIVRIVRPGAYRATAPMQFSDAEYIMVDDEKGADIATLIRNNSSIIVSGASIKATVYIEDPNNPGAFVATGDSYTAQINDLFQGESKLIEFTEDQVFIPETYSNFFVNDVNLYSIPQEFLAMTTNVSPLYKMVFELEHDENMYNNKIEKVVRFFVKRAELDLLISGEELMFGPNLNSMFGLNTIANNLNVDSLIQGFYYLGWYNYPQGELEVVDFDVFDRSVWEPRSVDYSLYRTLIWADGDDVLPTGFDNVIGRYYREHIADFLASGTPEMKKNLVIGSQDMVRNNFNHGLVDFNNTILRANYLAPGNPLGVGGDYSGNIVKGVNVGRDVEIEILTTEFNGDSYPAPALVSVAETGDVVGKSNAAFKYNTHQDDNPPIYAPEENRIMGVATSAITQNAIYFGLDWRHWGDIESALRSIFDYIQANGSPLYDDVIPVELAGFNAEPAGARVDLNWRTANEQNSAYFSVERADANGNNYSAFEAIDQIPAAGKSVTFKYYSTSDFDVQFGNTYAYRLKMVDQDGTFEYSDVKFVTLTGTNGSFTVNQPMPNPAINNTSVEYSLGEQMNVEIALYDITGSKVMSLFNGIKEAGNHSIDIDVHELTSGNYSLIFKVGADVVIKQINVVR